MKTVSFFSYQLILLGIPVLGARAAHIGDSINSKPNIVIILADDMGFSDVGCYGGEIKTPNIDRLANEGVRFTQFYNAARCCPTRASLLTGLYPHQVGMGGMVHSAGPAPGPYQGYLNDHCVTIAEVLKDAGYYTAASGKWHVGEERPHWPTDRGFDNYYGLISGASNYFDITRSKAQNVRRVFAIDSTSYTPPSDGFYMTDALTDHAVQYINKASAEKQPFFLYLAYTAPHWPLHALTEDVDLYRGRFLKGWDVSRRDRFSRMKELGLIEEECKISERDSEVMEWNSLTNEQKEKMDLLMAIYAAQIHRMDVGIGKVLDQLDERGVANNTMVLFLSDNGGCHEGGIWGQDFWGNFWDSAIHPGSVDSYHSYGRSWANLSNTPFRMFKHWVHEGGISTPLIVRWPAGILDSGKIISQPGHVVDIMATCCDLAGVSYPEIYKDKEIIPLEGKSLLSVIKAGEDRDSRKFFWEHEGNKAVREGNWKLVSKNGGEWELYNINIDRTEENNLIDSHKSIAIKLGEAFAEWAEKVGVGKK